MQFPVKTDCTLAAKLTPVGATATIRSPNSVPMVARTVSEPVVAFVVTVTVSDVLADRLACAPGKMDHATSLRVRGSTWFVESRTTAMKGALWLIVIWTSGVPKLTGTSDTDAAT